MLRIEGYVFLCGEVRGYDLDQETGSAAEGS